MQGIGSLHADIWKEKGNTVLCWEAYHWIKSFPCTYRHPGLHYMVNYTSQTAAQTLGLSCLIHSHNQPVLV